VSAGRDATLPAERPAANDAERERCLEKRLRVLAERLPLLRVLQQRVEEASGGASDEGLRLNALGRTPSPMRFSVPSGRASNLDLRL
jgi:hypothetical protein